MKRFDKDYSAFAAWLILEGYTVTEESNSYDVDTEDNLDEKYAEYKATL